MNETEIQKIHYTDTIHYELERTAKLMKMLTIQLFDHLEINLSFDECVALDLIACNNGICQRDLAKLIIKDRANTGRIVNILEEKGYIERNFDTKNNRLVKKINVSKSGNVYLKNITNKIKSYLEGVTTTISPEEIDKVRDTLKIFRLNLEKVVETNI